MKRHRDHDTRNAKAPGSAAKSDRVRVSIAFRDVLAHLRVIDAAGCREGLAPSKAELRAMAAEAVAQFRGVIRRLPTGPTNN